MEKFNQIVDLLDSLSKKYNFDEEDNEKIRQLVFSVETTKPEDMMGDEFVADEEEIAEE